MTRIERRKTPRTNPNPSQPALRARRGQHRERDFGIGYGNSSGYGSTFRYTRDWAGAPRFRCS